jgi:hypothetical protein
MKHLIIGITLLFSSVSISAQFIAELQLDEPVEGICNMKHIYSLFPMFDGQEEAICPITKEQVLARLNSEIQFLKENPKFKSKGMIDLLINCKGEVVQCKMDTKTKDKNLDKQIEALFSKLGKWKAGKLDGRPVDSSLLYSFKIKKGKVTFE